MIEDEIPEVAQARRLGHRLGGVQGICSHVSAAVEQRIVDALQERWKRGASLQDVSTGAQPVATSGNQSTATPDDQPQPPAHLADPHIDDTPDADTTPEAA